jgi:RNA polymerase sigma-70 factor, ECF subfamily
MPTVEARALDQEAGRRPGPIGAGTLERQLEQHRPELTAFCRRMLGWCDAEDAVQETLVRAWRAFDRFEGRAALRSWLYRIAFNVCLDCSRARQRHTRRIEMTAHDPTRVPTPSHRHRMTASATPTGVGNATLSNPAETAVAREAVGFALATLMRLPPRQRAVLILRDVLRWKAVEVAELLDTTMASVNSALQRARSTLAARNPTIRDHPRTSHNERSSPATSTPSNATTSSSSAPSFARTLVALPEPCRSQRPVSRRLSRAERTGDKHADVSLE